MTTHEQRFLDTAERLIMAHKDAILTEWHNVIKVDDDQQAVESMLAMTSWQVFDLLQFLDEVFEVKYVWFFEELEARLFSGKDLTSIKKTLHDIFAAQKKKYQSTRQKTARGKYGSIEHKPNP